MRNIKKIVLTLSIMLLTLSSCSEFELEECVSFWKTIKREVNG